MNADENPENGNRNQTEIGVENETGTEGDVIRMVQVSVSPPAAPASVLVEGVDWTVRVGEYWVVAGGSGSGKSLFLAVAAGLIPPVQGSVYLFGTPVTELGGDRWLPERMRVGVVFEDGERLFSNLTVLQNVALPLCYHRNCSESAVLDEVGHLMDVTSIGALAHRTPRMMGRAERQRVVLARALALRPEVLLVDNPVGRHDAEQRQWWLTMLRSLSTGHPALDGKPMTLVVAAHHFRYWRDDATHFGVIHGRAMKVVGDRSALNTSAKSSMHEWVDDGVSVS